MSYSLLAFVDPYTTFGWILFHNDWINQPSTHANVEKKRDFEATQPEEARFKVPPPQLYRKAKRPSS